MNPVRWFFCPYCKRWMVLEIQTINRCGICGRELGKEER